MDLVSPLFVATEALNKRPEEETLWPYLDGAGTYFESDSIANANYNAVRTGGQSAIYLIMARATNVAVIRALQWFGVNSSPAFFFAAQHQVTGDILTSAYGSASTTHSQVWAPTPTFENTVNMLLVEKSNTAGTITVSTWDKDNSNGASGDTLPANELPPGGINARLTWGARRHWTIEERWWLGELLGVAAAYGTGITVTPAKAAEMQAAMNASGSLKGRVDTALASFYTDVEGQVAGSCKLATGLYLGATPLAGSRPGEGGANPIVYQAI